MDSRPEGVYVSSEVYPAPPAVGGRATAKIEVVGGDRTDVIVLTKEEAHAVIKELIDLGF